MYELTNLKTVTEWSDFTVLIEKQILCEITLRIVGLFSRPMVHQADACLQISWHEYACESRVTFVRL